MIPDSAKRAVGPLALWVGLVAAAYFGLPRLLSHQTTHIENTPLEEYELPLLDGTAMHSADLSGRVVMLDFWTTWCGPCISQMPALQTLHEQYEDRDNFVFVAVNRGEDLATIRGFLDKHSYTFAIAVDSLGLLNDQFQASPIPQSFLIGRNGNLRLRHVGYSALEDFTGTMAEHISRLLEESVL